MNRTTILAFTLFFSAFATCANAADREREQRLSEQALATLFTGEPVTLNADGTGFLALETEADTEAAKGAVILLHGRGLHPDSEFVVGPLRETLAEDGWHTLSIQLPVLEKGKKYYDYVEIFPQALPRIDAAIEHLKNRYDKIVLLAHSCGVHMSMAWLRNGNGDRDGENLDAIDAYVGVGMGATDYKQPMQQPFAFEKMTVPVLDVFGSADYPAVVRNAGERREALAKAGNGLSKQISIDGADHNFVDYEDALFEAVSSWLNLL